MIELPTNSIQVLDKGYCRLVDHMGNDLRVANAARVSYNKESKNLTEKDIGLIRFLAEHGHTSPFRHVMLQFEIYVPLMVARQHWKYVVGSDHIMDAWNESSRRYVTEEPVFYLPDVDKWRAAPENKKQGSGGVLPAGIAAKYTHMLEMYQKEGERLYEYMMAEGVAAEQARLFLPAYGLYVRYYWTASLQSVAHFLNQRLDHAAQYEIMELAKAVHTLAKDLFSTSLQALVDDKRPKHE